MLFCSCVIVLILFSFLFIVHSTHIIVIWTRAAGQQCGKRTLQNSQVRFYFYNYTFFFHRCTLFALPNQIIISHRIRTPVYRLFIYPPPLFTSSWQRRRVNQMEITTFVFPILVFCSSPNVAIRTPLHIIIRSYGYE